MTRGEIFAQLEIQETKDTNLIRQAYIKKLQVTNPEDNPEGFKLLRQAYEEAMQLAQAVEDNSPVGLWIKDVKNTYDNFNLRIDKWAWEEIFDDEVCNDAGTYTSARNEFLRFVMDNIYLPSFAYEMAIAAFDIKEDYEELCDAFPSGFIDFVLRGGNGLKIEQIEAESGQDADRACDIWFNYRNAVAEKDEAKKAELIAQYEMLTVKMPYFISDMACFYAEKGDKDKAMQILDSLEDMVSDDGFIAANCASAYMSLGNSERALTICDIIEEKFPGNIKYKIVRADALVEDGKLAEAKKMYEDIYAKTNSQDIFDKLQEVNARLITNLLNSESIEDKLELGWCYYQNEQNAELMKHMDSFVPTEDKDLIMYYNLRGRALLIAERYDEAIECINKWRQMLFAQTTNNDKDENDRKRRIVMSAFFGARCLRIMADNNKDDNLRLKALEMAEDTTVCEEKEVVLQLWLERASILKDMHRYEDAIKLCDDIIETDRNCLPAYTTRQECNFELRRATLVLDDYRNVMDLIPDLKYGLPYALAAHVFVIYDRYDNAMSVIEHADENEVQSDYLEYVRASALRYMAKSNDDTQKAMDILLKIADKDKKERIDFNERRSIELFEEICYGYMDLEKWDDAIKAIDTAIAMQPDNIERYRTKLDIYKKSQNPSAVIKCLAKLKKDGKSPFVYYEMAKFVEENDSKKAIKNYKKAFELDENYRDTAAKLRDVYRREYLKNFDKASFNEALKYADKAVELYGYANEYLSRGILNMDAGMPEAAETDFLKAIELNDEYVIALEWLGDALRIQGKHNNAIKYYEEAYNLSKGDGNYYPSKDYALGLDAAMEYDKAVEILLEAIENFPQEHYFWISLARVYKKMHEYDKAFDAFMNYRNIPNLTPIRYADVDLELLELAVIMGRRGDEVLRLLNSMQEENYKLPEAHINLAEYYCYYNKDKKRSISHINTAINLANSQNDSFSYERAWRLRNEYLFVFNDKAQIKLKKMIGPRPAFSAVKAYKDKRYKKMHLYTLALNAYCEGDKKTSFKLFKDMQEGPNCYTCGYNVCVEALIGKGLMLQEEGRYDEAMECFERVLKENFDPHLINVLIERLKEKK